MERKRYTKRQKEAMKIARELCYGKEVILRIQNTRDSHAIDRILRKARIGE